MNLITGRQLPISELQLLRAFSLGGVFCRHQAPISPHDPRLTLAGLEDVLTDLTKVLWLSPTVVAAVLKKAREAKQ
jgi:hypothetical protein